MRKIARDLEKILIIYPNKIYDFLQKHPRFVAFWGLVIALVGGIRGEPQVAGYGLGVACTAFLFVYRE